MKILTRVILAAMLVVPSTTSAQMAPGVSVGDRIRSNAGTGWQGTGTVLQAGSDSLVVNSDATGTPVVLRRADTGRLEIRNGVRRHTLPGFAVGALTGASAGAILGFASGDQKCNAQQQAAGWDCANLKTAGDVAVAAGIFFGVLGGSIGTVVGFLKTSDRWIAVGTNRVAVSPIIGGDGHLGVSLKF